MGLTRHATTMHLMIEFPGHRVVPRQRFGPIPQFLMSAASKHGTETLMAHWKVMENLQHIEENRNRDRVQHNRLERTHHLEQQH